MLDSVVMVIVLLTGAFIFAYFGSDAIVDGIRIVYSGMVQIASAVWFHDMVRGPFAEDDTVLVVIFNIRDAIGIGNR